MLSKAKDGLRAKRKILSVSFSVGALAAVAAAQQPLVSMSSAPPQASSMGTQAVDVIPLRAYIGGTPLRHGNVVSGSERVDLNGRSLQSGSDYAMDYAAGVIYLKVTQKLGDSLLVSYNYDSKPGPSAAGSSFNGFQLNVLPGTSLIMGFGMAERQSDGNIVSSNVFGWRNSMSFGGSSLSGLMLVGNQQSSFAQNKFSQGESSSPSAALPFAGGESHFLLQNYKTGVMGGSMTLDFQNISKNFANFSAVHAAGYSDADVARLQAEKGLSRTAFGFNGLKLGSLSFDNSMRSVKDDHGAITWRNFALAQGGMKFNYSSQKVDDGFGRFSDLSESDKSQLLKERGMSRQSLGAMFQENAGKFSFQDLSIADDNLHNGLHRQDFSFDATRLHAGYGSEKVDSSFLRSSSLTAAEANQYGREVGMSRNWVSLSFSPTAKSGPLSFNQTELTSPSGKFFERDAAFTGKTLSVQHIDLGGSSGFASMAALQDDAVNSDLQKIAGAFGAAGAPSAADKNALIGNPSLHRDYTSVATEFSKKWNAKFNSVSMKGSKDSGYSTDASVSNGSLAAAFHRQAFGANFAEAANLMPLEQARLGVLPGLRREDFTFADQISKSSKLALSSMKADLKTGGVARTTLDYDSKGLTFNISQRKVDSGFTVAGQLVDPEAAVLASLAGYQQRNLNFTWNKLPNFTVVGQAQDARDQATGELKGLSNYKLNWNFDKTTQLQVIDNRAYDTTPHTTVLRNEMRQLSFAKDFGKYGKFAFLDEMDVNDGTSSSLPSSHRDYLSYEGKLSATTSLRAEQTVTNFADGTSQGISAETLSTQLSKRLGVSLTQAQVTGTAKTQEPGKSDYGIWYDLGNGVRISYGYAHQYNDGNGTQTTGLTVGANSTAPANNQLNTLTPGTIGSISLAGGYGATQYEAAGGSHTQSFSNVSLSTVKPVRFGPLTNLKFNLGMDTAADYTAWSKNSRAGGVSGLIGNTLFAFDYKGQLAAQGVEGIDRSFKLQTAQSSNSWLQAALNYKLRTLPGNVSYVIRDYNITAKPLKNLEVTNQLQTNPEVVNSGVFLGSIPQAARSNKWSLDYHQGLNSTLGGSYQELINTASNLRTTTGGLTLKLFQKSGSPLTLFFGEEDTIGGGIPHRLTSRYSCQFDQHPGPHQTLSMFLGNVSYDYNNPTGFNRTNWTARMDYQLRF